MRKMLAHHAQAVGIEPPISPDKLPQVQFTWHLEQGIDDTLIKPFFGHEGRASLELVSQLAIAEVHAEYNQVKGTSAPPYGNSNGLKSADTTSDSCKPV